MLYIVNTSKKFKQKGVQDYEIRVGDPYNFNVIGKFKHHAEKPLISLLSRASGSVGNYNALIDFLYKYQNGTIENNENKDQRENLIAVMVANISPEYKKEGLQNYVIQILTSDKEKNYKEELGRFDHIYEDGANVCFEKAIEVLDKSFCLKNYKKITKEIEHQNAEELEQREITFAEMSSDKKALMIKMYEDKTGIEFNAEQLSFIFQDIKDTTFADFHYDVEKKYLDSYDASFLLSFMSLRLIGEDWPSMVDYIGDKKGFLNYIDKLQKAVSYPDWEVDLYSAGGLPGKKISRSDRPSLF